MMELLLLKRISPFPVNVNVQDDEGNTPLHLAVLLKRVHLLPVLIINGADRSLLNKNYMTALMVSKNLESTEITNILLVT